MERRRGLYKNYLSDSSYENKRNVKKMEKASKYEPRWCEVEAMDKITEDLEDASRRHNSKILYYNKKLRIYIDKFHIYQTVRGNEL